MAGNHACFERGPYRNMQMLNREPTEEEVLLAIKATPYLFGVGDRVYNLVTRRYGIVIMVNDHSNPNLQFDYVIDYPGIGENAQLREPVKNAESLIRVR